MVTAKGRTCWCQVWLELQEWLTFQTEGLSSQENIESGALKETFVKESQFRAQRRHTRSLQLQSGNSDWPFISTDIDIGRCWGRSTSGSFLCPRTSKVRKCVNTNILTSREAVFSEQTESTAAPMASLWGTFMSHSLGFLAYTRQSFSCMLCYM